MAKISETEIINYLCEGVCVCFLHGIICDKRTLQGYRSHKRAQLYERNYEACFLLANIHSQTAMSFFEMGRNSGQKSEPPSPSHCLGGVFSREMTTDNVPVISVRGDDN